MASLSEPFQDERLTVVHANLGRAARGARQVFADAGFEKVSRPIVRRVVMRIDFPTATRMRVGGCDRPGLDGAALGSA
jgi:hypothetical protein